MTDALQPLPFNQLVQTMVDQFVVFCQLNDIPITDLSEGSETRALFEAVGAPLEELMLRQAVDLPRTYYFGEAKDERLDRLILNFTFGLVERIDWGTAVGEMRIEAAAGTTIPVNAVFASPAGVKVKVLVGGQVADGDTAVTLAATAVERGAQGNLPAGTLLAPDAAIAGFTRATIVTAWSEGVDRQTDEEYLGAMVGWLDSLSRGTIPAIIVGAGKAGYSRVFAQEPGNGRVVMYLDDGGPVSSTKIEAARLLVHRSYKAGGARLKAFGFVEKRIRIPASALASPNRSKADLETDIAAKWGQLMATKRMGDGLSALELLAVASQVPGYNGVNLGMTDITVRQAINEYLTTFGAGGMYPYERLVLDGVDWS